MTPLSEHHNELEWFIECTGKNELRCMNLLQNHGGIISDCCVNAADVAPSDCAAAIAFLADPTNR